MSLGSSANVMKLCSFLDVYRLFDGILEFWWIPKVEGSKLLVPENQKMGGPTSLQSRWWLHLRPSPLSLPPPPPLILPLPLKRGPGLTPEHF